MTQPVTEIAYITLKPGLTVEGDTPAAQVWKDTLETVSAQEGFQKYYYGTQLEREDVLMFLIGKSLILISRILRVGISGSPGLFMIEYVLGCWALWDQINFGLSGCIAN